MAMDAMLNGGVLDEIDEELREEQKNQQERKEREGQLYPFRMPKLANADGNRTATLRFRTPWDEGIKVLEHSQWGVLQMVCPAEFGMDCQICNALVKKHKLSGRDALLDRKKLPEYTRGEQISTRFIRIWQVWYYEARDGAGGNYLFAYPVNKNSPIQTIHALNKQRYIAPEEGETPMALTDYDVRLTQFKAEQERSFTAANVQSKPKKFAHTDKSSRWTADDMKFGYALSVSRDDKAYLTRLQQLRHEAQKAGLVSADRASPRSVVDSVGELVEADLNLEFEE